MVKHINRRSGVLAEVQRFFGGETERRCLQNADLCDLNAVHEESSCAALAHAATVIGEVHHDGMLARQPSRAMLLWLKLRKML